MKKLTNENLLLYNVLYGNDEIGKSIKEYTEKFDVKNYDDLWFRLYDDLNVTNFILDYFSKEFNNDQFIADIQDIFNYLSERKDKYEFIKDDNDSYLNPLWHKASEFYDKTSYYRNDYSILYEGEEELYLNTDLEKRDWNLKNKIEPKSSLLNTFIEPSESMYDHWRLYWPDYDFEFKLDQLRIALMQNDIEYNKNLAEEYYYLCRLIIEDKYIYHNKEWNIIELLREKGKVNINDNWRLRSMKQIVWSENSLLCLYQHYKFTKNEEVIKFLLQCMVMSCLTKEKIIDAYTEDSILRNWQMLQEMDTELLLDKYIREAEIYYHNIKNKNKFIKEEIDNLLLGKEDRVLKNNNVIQMNAGALDFNKVKEHTQSCGPYTFHLDLPESEEFKMNNNSYKQWLITFFNGFNKESDEYFKDNKSYNRIKLDMMIVEEDLSKKFEDKNPDMAAIIEEDFSKDECIASINLTDYKKMPTDYDFYPLKEKLEMYYLDDAVRFKIWEILNNKDNLAKMYPLYQEFDLPLKDEINEYLQNYVVRGQSLDDMIFEDICYIHRNDIYNVSNPIELANTLSAQKEMLCKLNPSLPIKKNYERFIETQAKEVNELVKNWKEFSPQEVKLNSFFSEIEDNVKILYGDNFIKEEYEDAKKTVIEIIATGEVLYNSFILDNLEVKDYSVVAIQYYRALEYFLNTILYIPYKKNVLDKIIDKAKDDIKLREKYYGNAGDAITRKKYKKNEDNIMLGSFQHLFIEKEPQYLYDYFKRNDVNIEKLKEYIEKIPPLSTLRNECAHPNLNNEAFAARGRIAVYKKENEDIAKEEKRANDIFELLIDIKNIFK